MLKESIFFRKGYKFNLRGVIFLYDKGVNAWISKAR